jgi:hypothetical protein
MMDWLHVPPNRYKFLERITGSAHDAQQSAPPLSMRQGQENHPAHRWGSGNAIAQPPCTRWLGLVHHQGSDPPAEQRRGHHHRHSDHQRKRARVGKFAGRGVIKLDIAQSTEPSGFGWLGFFR